MNLQGFTSGVISAVSPSQAANLLLSTGPAATQADGSRPPTYAPPVFISAQTQPLSTGDIRKLDALNIQGAQYAIHFTGEARGIQRVRMLGGDLIIFADGITYLVKAVLENWYMDGWCRVAVVQQNDTQIPYVQRPRF